MSRHRDAAPISVGILPNATIQARTLLAVVAVLATLLAVGCEGLDSRRRTRSGNGYFREGRFIEAAAQYEEALKTLPSPIIHYNAGLAYTKMFSPSDIPLRIGVKGTFECTTLPNVKYEEARVCLKEGDRRFDDCDDTDNVCAASYKCTKTELCTLDNAVIAAAAADHFVKWIDANPKDDKTRAIMTQIWEDSKQHQLALDYWHKLLKERPGDMNVMGNLAGINLRAGNWRESIDLYLQVADLTPDTSQKVSMLQNVANVAWHRLKAGTLTQAEQIELADAGIGALQKATVLAPKNPNVWSFQGTLLNFRSLAHGASWAAFIDRASAQDPQKTSRVLREEAKKAKGEDPSTPNPSPAAAGGAAQPAGG